MWLSPGLIALSQLTLGISGIFTTVLISFAIGVFVQHLDRKQKGRDLDLHVALDHAWMLKPLLVILAVMAICILLMAWDIIAVQVVSFFVWVITLLALGVIVLNLYDWVKGDRNKFRLKYLNSLSTSKEDRINAQKNLWQLGYLKSLFSSSAEDKMDARKKLRRLEHLRLFFNPSAEDKVSAWSSVWEADWGKNNPYMERDYFVIFSRQIDEILKSSEEKDWHLLFQLLVNFERNIGNRDQTFLLMFDAFFPEILEWRVKLWENASSVDTVSDDIRVTSNVAKSWIDAIIRFVTTQALEIGGAECIVYMGNWEKHVSKYETKEVSGLLYLESLPIYYDFLPYPLHSPQKEKIWSGGFPMEWRVTVDNLKKHPISQIWGERFYKWFEVNYKPAEDCDYDIAMVAGKLFPEMQPWIWTRILTLQYYQDIETTIKNPPNWGNWPLSGMADKVPPDENEDSRKEEFSQRQKAAIECATKTALSLSMLDNFFTVPNVHTWLEELNELECKDECKEKRRWEMILNEFKKQLAEKEEVKDIPHSSAPE